MHKIWNWIQRSGFLFDLQQHWTSANYRAMQKAFKQFAKPNHRILEIGCATGSCVHRIWDGLKSYYVGVDLEFGYVKWGKHHYPKGLFLCADAATLPFKKTSFDIVCTFSVLHHLPDSVVQSLSKYLGENLSSETQILISEPILPPQSGSLSFSDRLSQFLLKHDRGRYIRTPENYLALFGDCFEVRSSFRFMYGVHHFCGFVLQLKK